MSNKRLIFAHLFSRCCKPHQCINSASDTFLVTFTELNFLECDFVAPQSPACLPVGRKVTNQGYALKQVGFKRMGGSLLSWPVESISPCQSCREEPKAVPVLLIQLPTSITPSAGTLSWRIMRSNFQDHLVLISNIILHWSQEHTGLQVFVHDERRNVYPLKLFLDTRWGVIIMRRLPHIHFIIYEFHLPYKIYPKNVTKRRNIALEETKQLNYFQKMSVKWYASYLLKRPN